MRGLFPVWANAALKWGVIGGLGIIIGVPLLLMGWVRTPYVTGQGRGAAQPVPFDHRHHVRDDAISCAYCHAAADRSIHAGMPASDVCMGCHSQILNDSPVLETIRESAYFDRPIAWRAVNALPDFVYFDHSAHVNSGVGCETCHGRVDLMARVRQAAPLTMQWCLDCHRDPEPHLRPREAVAVMGWNPPGDRRTLGRQLAEAYGVRTLTDCTTCHR